MSESVSSCLAPSFLPATAVFEMTYQCNHKCLFCSCPWEARNNGFERKKELDLDEWKNIVKTLTDMGVCSIAFSGGEPLLKKDIFSLMEYAAACKCEMIETENDSLVSKIQSPKLYLISNGTLMNEEVLDFCKKHDVHLSMSLPGLKTYYDHTKEGSPENILHWFRRAKEKGLSTTVNITVTAKNIFELYETIAQALLAGADNLLMNRFLPGGRGIKYQNELLLSIPQINEMLDIAEEVLSTSKRFGSVGTELPKCIIKNDHYVHLKIGTRCSAAIDFFVIGPSGNIRTCNHSQVEIGHFSEIQAIKNHEYWKRFVMKDYHPQMCQHCELVFDCDGGCREAAHICCGELNSPDPILKNVNSRYTFEEKE
jgi:radical SAM protein with 4Fe4S-binding SPASM domain